MRNGLLLGLDGAGKTLLLRHLVLYLSRNHKSVLDRIVALAQGASCIATGGMTLGASAAVGASGGGSASHGPSTGPTYYAHRADGGGHDGPSHTTPEDPPGSPLLHSDTQPTIGVEHTTLSIENRTFSICEIGGQLLPMWKAYFDPAEFWIYVVDVSDAAQIAGAAIEFLNIMRVEAMRRKPKLLVLNKVDAYFTLDDSILRAYLSLDRLITDAFSPTSVSGPMHVIKVSALNGENLDGVIKWIYQRGGNNAGAGTVGPSSAHVLSNQFSFRHSTGRQEHKRVHPGH